MSEKEPPVIHLNPKDSPLARLLEEGHIATDAPKWTEDKLIPYRWYHHRWDWLRLWWILWREGRAPFTGILCPLLGRHWYHDLRGFAMMWERWGDEAREKGLVCFHCRDVRIISHIEYPYKDGQAPFVKFKPREPGDLVE